MDGKYVLLMESTVKGYDIYSTSISLGQARLFGKLDLHQSYLKKLLWCSYKLKNDVLPIIEDTES